MYIENSKRRDYTQRQAHQITADSSTENLKARGIWAGVKGDTWQPRLLYPAQLYSWWKIKHFHDKHRLKEFITTNSALQKMPEGIFWTREKSQIIHEATGTNTPYWSNS